MPEAGETFDLAEIVISGTKLVKSIPGVVKKIVLLTSSTLASIVLMPLETLKESILFSELLFDTFTSYTACVPSSAVTV